MQLISRASLIVSDSGGVQEGTPSLGVPLLVVPEQTERPELLDQGVARVVGFDPARLLELLEEAHSGTAWTCANFGENSFGDGAADRRGPGGGPGLRGIRPGAARVDRLRSHLWCVC